MEVEQKEIEIVSWVKFNGKNTKLKVLKIADKCSSKMEFVKKIKDTFDIPLSDANVVANRFYNKEEV